MVFDRPSLMSRVFKPRPSVILNFLRSSLKAPSLRLISLPGPFPPPASQVSPSVGRLALPQTTTRVAAGHASLHDPVLVARPVDVFGQSRRGTPEEWHKELTRRYISLRGRAPGTTVRPRHVDARVGEPGGRSGRVTVRPGLTNGAVIIVAVLRQQPHRTIECVLFQVGCEPCRPHGTVVQRAGREPAFRRVDVVQGEADLFEVVRALQAV